MKTIHKYPHGGEGGCNPPLRVKNPVSSRSRIFYWLDRNSPVKMVNTKRSHSNSISDTQKIDELI
jgi:hypothetical protein